MEQTVTEEIAGIPRRVQMNRWTPAEMDIYNAIQAVEKVGAHPKLTEVVILLGKAREVLADYIDKTLEPKGV